MWLKFIEKWRKCHCGHCRQSVYCFCAHNTQFRRVCKKRKINALFDTSLCESLRFLDIRLDLIYNKLLMWWNLKLRLLWITFREITICSDNIWIFLIKTFSRPMFLQMRKICRKNIEMLQNNAQVSRHHQANAQTPNYNSYEFFRAFALKTTLLRGYTKPIKHKVSNSFFLAFSF